MHFILFRHAQRDSSSEEMNPGLSKKGRSQAEEIVPLFTKNKLPIPQKILVSPRVRSQQTLEPLAQQLKLKIHILSDLDERQPNETLPQFRERVALFLEKIASQNQNTVACSHLDWIEEALIAIHSDTDLLQAKFQHWTTAQFMHFKIDQGIWHLEAFSHVGD